MYKLKDSVAAMFALYGFVCLVILGALQRTVNGTWDQLPVSAAVTYLTSITVSGGAAVAIYNNRRAIGQSKKAAELASPVDKHGYHKDINWQMVARLEHEHGYDHVPESLAVCNRTECLQSWLDDMILEDAIPELMRLATAGIVTTNQLRELTGAAPEEVKLSLMDPYGRPIFSSDEVFGSTIDRLRSMPTEPNRDELNRQQSEWYKHELEKRKKEIEQKFKASHYTGNIMVVPDGFKVVPCYKQEEPDPHRYIITNGDGGLRANISAASGIVPMTALEAQALGYPAADGDWRRDDGKLDLIIQTPYTKNRNRYIPDDTNRA